MVGSSPKCWYFFLSNLCVCTCYDNKLANFCIFCCLSILATPGTSLGSRSYRRCSGELGHRRCAVLFNTHHSPPCLVDVTVSRRSPLLQELLFHDGSHVSARGHDLGVCHPEYFHFCNVHDSASRSVDAPLFIGRHDGMG